MGPVVEDCDRLDVRDLVGDLDAGQPVTIRAGDRFAISMVADTDEGVACLVRAVNDRVYSHAWPVNVVRCLRAVGGRRWLFRCPACGLLRAALFLPPGSVHLRCRRCHRAHYVSQRVSWNSVPALGERRRRYRTRLARARSEVVKTKLRARLRRIDQEWEAKVQRLVADKMALVEEVVADVCADECVITAEDRPSRTRGALGRVARARDAGVGCDEVGARINDGLG